MSKLKILGLFVLLTASFFGCKDDLSTMDTIKLPDITVDTTGQPILNVFQFDRLQVDPKIIENNLNGHTLSYEWFINLEPWSSEYITIGTAKQLDYEVSFAPPLTGITNYHQILLKITDENTGIAYYQDWPLTIRNSIGEGLVIAETYDGSTTDISHIMSPLVTPNYSLENIRYRIFSGVNGTTIPGLIKNMRYTRMGSDNIMLSATSNSLFTIKTLDYQMGLQNEELFYAPQPSYGADFIIYLNSPQNDIIVHNNQIFATWLQLTRFGLPGATTYQIPNIVALNNYNTGGVLNEIQLNFYSEEHGHFVFQPRFGSFGDRVMRPVPSFEGVFNPNDVPNKANVAAGVNRQGDFLHLLKDKSTNKHELYIVDGGGWDAVDFVVIPSKPKRYIDFSAAPEIDQATHFVFLDDQDVLLYTTDTKIYAAIYSAATPSYAVRYTAATGEEITTLRGYYQASYPQTSGPFSPQNGRQLVLSTYDGSEGKVHILPLINTGLANIDEANIKTYSGFGKILFTATQL